MKKLVVGVALTIIGAWGVLNAASQDGTSTLVYKNNLQIFRNGLNEYVRGFVRLDNGFAVGPGATAFMDTNISVSGPFDLGETGMLVLLNSMYTDGPITLTGSGNIKGKATVSGDAKTIFLGGDLTLSATTYARVLHITGDWSNSGTSGDLIIDGQGHLLDIQDRTQIFVDQNVTLTLRNMTIRTGPKSFMTPPIRLASMGSKLVLDNVMFDLGADFQFKQGQLFIYDEVAVTGTSAFIYQSPVPSYITSGATWSFESGTTFSVAPVTFTDCPFTVNNTYTSNKFIILADVSSALYLNACSLKTTYTGLRLTQGMVMLDNCVKIDTQAGVDLASTATTPVVYLGQAATGSTPFTVAWSPNGRFVAAVSYSSNMLQVYRFNGSSAPVQVGGTVFTGAQSIAVAWSPDGRFLALVCLNASTLQVYRFNGSSSLVPVGAAVSVASFPHSVVWSPDGRLLAVVSWAGNPVQIYRFSGVDAPVFVTSAVEASVQGITVAWSPDGRFVAAVNYSGLLKVYRFNGSNVLSIVGTATTSGRTQFVAWSPDSRFLAAVTGDLNTLQVFRFSGSTPVQVGNTVTTGSTPYAVDWSPDGRFLVVANRGASTLQIYKFNGSSEPTTLGTTVITGNSPATVAWSPDGRFLAVGCGGTSNTLQVFRCNYYYTGQPSANQGFTNSLLFGDSVKGSGYNVDVNVAGSARVEVNGKVTDDSA